MWASDASAVSSVVCGCCVIASFCPCTRSISSGHDWCCCCRRCFPRVSAQCANASCSMFNQAHTCLKNWRDDGTSTDEAEAKYTKREDKLTLRHIQRATASHVELKGARRLTWRRSNSLLAAIDGTSEVFDLWWFLCHCWGDDMEILRGWRHV